MKLFQTAFCIAFRHSGRRLLCLLLVLLLCTGLLLGFFMVPREQDAPERVVVGIINLDDSPLSISMLNSLLEGENLSDLMELTALPADGTGKEACSAVVTIPQGFLESVLTGENRSPIVDIHINSPLETMWLRQIVKAGASVLSSAQAGIYAVLDAAGYGKGMDPRAYNLLVADVNLTFLRSFFERLSLLEPVKLSASGTLSLFEYYGVALLTAVLFCYGFLFYPALADLRRFGRQLPQIRQKVFLTLSGALHVLVWEGVLTFPLLILLNRLGGKSRIPEPMWRSWLLLTLLMTAVALFCARYFQSPALCAAGTLLLTLGQSLCGGAILPLELLPSTFTQVSRFFPLPQGMSLLRTALGVRLPPGGLPILFGTILILLALAFVPGRQVKKGRAFE